MLKRIVRQVVLKQGRQVHLYSGAPETVRAVRAADGQDRVGWQLAQGALYLTEKS